MKNPTSIENLLRWRWTLAEQDAPPAPRARRLLELSRPWWERWPEDFRAQAKRLGGIQLRYGHAMTAAPHGNTGYPVPVLLLATSTGVEMSARVLHFDVRNDALRLRVELEGEPRVTEPQLEATFVSEPDGRPLFVATAVKSIDHEFAVDVLLEPELIDTWKHLRVTDRMPFRLLLRPVASDTP